MIRKQQRTPQFLLIAFFAIYYCIVEYLLVSNISLTSLSELDFIVIAIISFLNLIPAGIFALAMVSILPREFSSSINEENLLAHSPPIFRPRVAVLYATYNDFMEPHAEYDLLEAQAGRLEFFLLDDSTDPCKKGEVKEFATRFGCSVLRRDTRKGYKAGAINAWIKQFGNSYDYFFILDSDSRAGLEGIKRCVELARRNPRIAVVQTKTLTMTSNPSRLTKSSVCVQHAYMEIVQKAMRNLGTSPYYGHNALISIAAIRDVGGFVEESNEDYKTLARLHDRGYESIYAEGAVTWEEVPPDYLSSRKRSLRWSRDAVSQLGLLRFGSPLAITFFLFYGWVTHISNLALMILLFTATSIALPHLFSNTSTEVAGFIALSAIVLWPLLALGTKDPELKSGNMLRALLWGSVYNIPMMTPLGLQILKTAIQKASIRLSGFLGYAREIRQEFVVTPKTKHSDSSVSSIVRNLKVETSFGIAMTIVALMTDHAMSLIFAAPQIVSSISIPLLV
ncbi:MAG: glycosyltransferase, partial [Nitrososphaerota archaeon]|nr:glycosyltransferase [Nitrososphaerota archaeon]